MKKLITILAIIFCASLLISDRSVIRRAEARMIMGIIGGSVPDEGGPADPCGCATASYLSCYTGDHASGADYICYDSGNSNKQGSESGTIEVTSDYVTITAANEWLQFANVTEDLVQADVGTAWMTIYIDAAVISSHVNFLEFGGTNNNDYLGVKVEDDGTARNYYRQADTGVVLTSVATVSGQTPTRIGVSWDQPNDDLKLCVTATCIEETNASINGLGVWSEIRIGKNIRGLWAIQLEFMI